MKIIIACNSFKGSCTTEQVAEAITRGIKEAFPQFLPKRREVKTKRNGKEETAHEMAETTENKEPWQDIFCLEQ